jgi:hypothetical protein
MIIAGPDFIEALRVRHCDRSSHFGVAVWRAKEAESDPA